MAKVWSVDKARPALADLVDEVVAKKKPVVISRRKGKAAVLVSYEEFTVLKAVAEGKVKARLKKALKEIRRAVRKSRLKPQLVNEAVRAARGIR